MTICLLTIFLSGVAFSDDYRPSPPLNDSLARQNRQNTKLQMQPLITGEDVWRAMRGMRSQVHANTERTLNVLMGERERIEKEQDAFSNKFEKDFEESLKEFWAYIDGLTPDPQPPQQTPPQDPSASNDPASPGDQGDAQPPTESAPSKKTTNPTSSTTPQETPKDPSKKIVAWEPAQPSDPNASTGSFIKLTFPDGRHAVLSEAEFMKKYGTQVEDPSKIVVDVQNLPLPAITNAPLPTRVKVTFKDGRTEEMLQSTYEREYRLKPAMKEAINKTEFGNDCLSAAEVVGNDLRDDALKFGAKMSVAGATVLTGHPAAAGVIVSEAAAEHIAIPIIAYTINGDIPKMISQCGKMPMRELYGNTIEAMERYQKPHN